MKRTHRLPTLLLVLVAVLLLRWWSPPAQDASDIAQAVVRPTVGTASATPDSPRRADVTTLSQLARSTREIEPIAPRNAFAVRMPPVVAPPPAPPAPPRVVAAAGPPPFVGPPAPEPPPPAPPPPLQVIGSWRDDQGASVFMSAPSGVVQGRVGDTVLSQYRIAQITPQRVLFLHLPTKQDVALAVPAAAAAPLQP